MNNDSNEEFEEESEEVVESTLFEDLERIQQEQEQEDLKTLEEDVYEEEVEDEDTKINKTQKLFLNDGKLDYDLKSPINFKIGEEAEHFNLTPEELDRFSKIYEDIYKLGFSQAVYDKSLRDQIKQKGNKIDISRAVSTWESMLDKLCDLKMLDFLCDEIGITSNLKEKILDKEIDKLFSKPVINIHKDNSAENSIMDQLKSITKKLSKAGV